VIAPQTAINHSNLKQKAQHSEEAKPELIATTFGNLTREEIRDWERILRQKLVRIANEPSTRSEPQQHSSSKPRRRSEVEMTQYFGVKCATCEEPISLATYSIDESRKRSFSFVPVVPVPRPYCGTSHLYASPDAIYFDGPDGLLPQRVGRN
jgi:hypothetical protein